MKNTMNLDAFSVEELSHTETLENEGGIVWYIPVLVGAAVSTFIANFKDVREGIQDGYNQVPPRH